MHWSARLFPRYRTDAVWVVHRSSDDSCEWTSLARDIPSVLWIILRLSRCCYTTMCKSQTDNGKSKSGNIKLHIEDNTNIWLSCQRNVTSNRLQHTFIHNFSTLQNYFKLYTQSTVLSLVKFYFLKGKITVFERDMIH